MPMRHIGMRHRCFNMAAAVMMFLRDILRRMVIRLFGICAALVINAKSLPIGSRHPACTTAENAACDHHDASGGDLSSIRTLVYGAAASCGAVLRRAIKALPTHVFFHATVDRAVARRGRYWASYQTLVWDTSQLSLSSVMRCGVEV